MELQVKWKVEKQSRENGGEKLSLVLMHSSVKFMPQLPLITFTVHYCIDAPIKQLIFHLKAKDPMGTEFVMLTTTAISITEATHFCVLLGCPTTATPLGVRHH